MKVGTLPEIYIDVFHIFFPMRTDDEEEEEANVPMHKQASSQQINIPFRGGEDELQDFSRVIVTSTETFPLVASDSKLERRKLKFLPHPWTWTLLFSSPSSSRRSENF
jgi:hypothetical protein